MPITDQADIQSLLSIESFGITPDPRVTASIAAAQAAIEVEAGFKFDEQLGMTATLTGDGESVLSIPMSRRPVTAVAVTEGGVSLVDGTDFTWTPAGTLVRLLNGVEAPWSTIHQDIVVTYDAGWADKTVAADALRWLVARVAARFWTQGVGFSESQGAVGVKQESVQGYSVTYVDGLGSVGGLDAEEKDEARRWRRRVHSMRST